MKRVQVILEEWQCLWLSEAAGRQRISISALLRQLLTEAIEQRQAAALTQDPLFDAIGIADGPNDGITSENLDQFLYQVNRPERSTRMIAEGLSPTPAHEQSESDYR